MAVSAVLDSGMLVMGDRVRAFEERLAARVGRRFAVACSSGTSALQLALAALDIDDGEVLCPDLTWPSPAHAIALAGARPRLVDVDPATWNAGADAYRAARGASTRAAVAIDQFGMPADHDAIAEALGGLPTIVDGACALGSTRAGQSTLRRGTIATLSFHPRKVITTGEGGACLTDDETLAERLRVLRNHGAHGRGRFARPGGNHRMTDLAAAMGLAQLTRLDAMIARRRAIAARYRAALPACFHFQHARPGHESNWQTFGVVLKDARFGPTSAWMEALRAQEVEAGRLSYALHRLDSMAPFVDGRAFPHATQIEALGMALPMHPELEDGDVDRVVEAVSNVAKRRA